MVALETIRASNARLHELGPGLVALFVGGTSGIGEATLKAFLSNTVSPRIYIVGRSAPAAERIIAECKTLNGDGKVEFLQADVSELKEVDRICDTIKEKEKGLNLLVLSQGNLNLRGRDESPEGLDRKMTLNYYSRQRFTLSLLSLLRPTPSAPRFSRVVSVLAGGQEEAINLSDLALKYNFTTARCAGHTTTMNSLMVSELADREKDISFVHASPGAVPTALARELPWYARIPTKALMLALKVLWVSVEETGERQLFIATSGMFAPREGVKGIQASEVAQGADGKTGSGGYLVNWKGDVVGKPIVGKYLAEGVGKTVWAHTQEVFRDVEKINTETLEGRM